MSTASPSAVIISTASTITASPSAVSISKPSIRMHSSICKPRTDLSEEPLTTEREIGEPQANLQENMSASIQVTNDTEIDDPDLTVNWSDFDDDFTVDDAHSIQQGKIIYLIPKIYT